MGVFVYTIAGILGGALCVMIGANVWRFLPAVEFLYSAALFVGGLCGLVVLVFMLAYQRKVVEPLERKARGEK